MGAEAALRRHVECSITDLAELDDGSIRTVAGVVTGLARKYTKRGDLMATFVLEDLAAAIEVMVFPKTMLQYGELLDADAIVVVKAASTGAKTRPSSWRWRSRAPSCTSTAARPSRLRVKAGVLDDDRVAKLRELLRTHPGHSQVFVQIVGPEKETVLRLGDEFNCEPATASTPSSASSSAPTASRNSVLEARQDASTVCSGVWSELSIQCPTAASRRAGSGRAARRSTRRRNRACGGASRATRRSPARARARRCRAGVCARVTRSRPARADHAVLPDGGVSGLGVAVGAPRAERVAHAELGLERVRVRRAFPRTIIRRNRSPRRCADRSKRSASNCATVVFPDAITPVTSTTRP
jgi:hypothetical protein